MSHTPRRNRLNLFIPAERAIWDAAGVVESTGTPPRLTDAVNLLAEAREAVADFVDHTPSTRPSPVDQWRALAYSVLAEAKASNDLAEEAINQSTRILRQMGLWVVTSFVLGAFLTWAVLS